MVIKEALQYGLENLKDNLYTDPINESRTILSFLLNKDVSFTYIYPEYQLEDSIKGRFIEIIDMRKSKYPLQYIFNKADFYGREFYVDERCLIPRWDTENLIEVVKDLSKNLENPEILEIGPGSGAISITLALEIPNSNVLGGDISTDALEVCEINKDKYDVDNLEFIHSNLFENINSKYDIIVSNPPYITSEDMKTLQDEVKKEPKLALDGGKDGLDFYKKITEESKLYLKNKGFLVFEIGHNQYEDIKNILEYNNFENINYKCDLQGYKRVIWTNKGE